jgi:hypothetical protein
MIADILQLTLRFKPAAAAAAAAMERVKTRLRSDLKRRTFSVREAA